MGDFGKAQEALHITGIFISKRRGKVVLRLRQEQRVSSASLSKRILPHTACTFVAAPPIRRRMRILAAAPQDFNAPRHIFGESAI